MFPQWDPYGERCSVSRANGLFIQLSLSESPFKELSYEIGGKHTVTVHGAPRGRKTYTQRVPSGSPRGSFTTLLLHQCHAAFGKIPSTLAWAEHSPVSQRVSYLSSVTASHVTQGRDPGNPEIRTEVLRLWEALKHCVS